MAKQNPAAGADDLPEITAESLRESHPELVAQFFAEGAASVDLEQLRTEAHAEGVAAENARIKAIEAVSMPGAEAVIAACKADASCTAEQAAIKVLAHIRANPQAEQTRGAAAYLAGLNATEQQLQAPAPAAVSGNSETDPTAAAVSQVLAAGRAIGVI